MPSDDRVSFSIHAVDQTAKAFAGVLANANKFTSRLAATVKAPFAGLAKIQLPLFAAVQNAKSFLELVKVPGEWAREAHRGSVVTAEFANRLGITEDRAYAAARALQEAAAGALNLDSVMETTNRLLAQGLDVNAISKIFRFATVRSKTTNEDFGGIVSGIGSALATGRVMALKQFGLISGDFKIAGKSIQQVMESAFAGMDAQLSKMGVSTEATVFTWDRMASAVDDVWDSIKDMLITSEVFNRTIQGTLGFFSTLRDFVNLNGSAIVDVYNSTFAAIGTGFRAILGPIASLAKRLFGDIGLAGASKGILIAGAAIGHVFGGALVKTRELIGTIKRGFLTAARDILQSFQSIAIGMSLTDEGAAAMQANFEAATRSLNRSILDTYREEGKWRDENERLGKSFDETTDSILKMTNATVNVGKPFEGLSVKLARFAQTITQPFQRIGSLLGKQFRDLGTAIAKGSADTIRDGFQRALDKVKELRDELNRLAGIRNDTELQIWQENLEQNVARIRASSRPNAEGLARREEFQFAKELMERAGDPQRTAEASEKMLQAANEILQRLATNPEIIRDRSALNQVTQLQQRGRADAFNRLYQVEEDTTNKLANARLELERSKAAQFAQVMRQVFSELRPAITGTVNEFGNLRKAAKGAAEALISTKPRRFVGSVDDRLAKAGLEGLLAEF